jgi:hypothetical protein
MSSTTSHIDVRSFTSDTEHTSATGCTWCPSFEPGNTRFATRSGRGATGTTTTSTTIKSITLEGDKREAEATRRTSKEKRSTARNTAKREEREERDGTNADDKIIHSLNFTLEKKMKRYIGIFLAIMVVFASIEVYASVKKKAKLTTQTFTYKIMSFNNEVGTAYVSLDRKRGKVSKLVGEFKTKGALHKFYPMENRQVTYVDRHGNPKKTFQKREERSGIENFNIKYKGQRVQVFYEKDGKESKRVRKGPNHIQDVLSALYMVSDWKAKEGTTLVMTMFSGKQFYKVQVTSAGLEEIWTPYRRVEDAIRVNVVIERISGGRKGEKNKLTLWVDAKRKGLVLKASYNFKHVGDVVVLLENQTFESTRKQVAKAKLKVRGKK